jgi:hypothetical protein
MVVVELVVDVPADHIVDASAKLPLFAAVERVVNGVNSAASANPPAIASMATTVPM